MVKRARQQWTEALDRQLDGIPERPKPRKHYTTKPPRQLEHDIQKGFIRWVDLQIPVIPELEEIFAIPNGGNRSPVTGAKMKAEGVRRGVPDLNLPVPVAPWAGFWIETKAPGGKLSKYQKDRIRRLRSYGHTVAVLDSVDRMIDTTLAYLDGAITDEQGTIAAGWRRTGRAC